jgi:hypothetical protein
MFVKVTAGCTQMCHTDAQKILIELATVARTVCKTVLMKLKIKKMTTNLPSNYGNAIVPGYNPDAYLNMGSYEFTRTLTVDDDEFEVFCKAKIGTPESDHDNGSYDDAIEILYLKFTDTMSHAEFDDNFQSGDLSVLAEFHDLYKKVQAKVYEYILENRDDLTDGYDYED